MGRTIAIPDIHGRSDLLEVLINTLTVGLKEWGPLLPDDLLVFLGDMIDRGLDSKGVIEKVSYLQETFPQNVVALKGNHEMFAIDSLIKGDTNAFETWMYPGNGGEQTLASFQGKIPQEVLRWLTKLPVSYETDKFFFSHAPAPRDSFRSVHRREQPYTDEELLWTYNRDEFGVANVFKDKVGVCGHIHKLRDGCIEPRFYPHYIFADAGCGCSARAPLVAINCESRQYISVTSGQKMGYMEPPCFNVELHDGRKKASYT